jgi:hypothetical protein
VVARAVLGVAIVLVAAGVACRARSSATANPPATAVPSARDACRACRGLWGVHGLDDKESCNCRTTDAGKRCQDGSDCQGMCIAGKDDPETEVVTPGPPRRGFFVGRCSELVTVFGCNRVIERGTRARGPVPLDEPPQKICVD